MMPPRYVLLALLVPLFSFCYLIYQAAVAVRKAVALFLRASYKATNTAG